MFCYIKDFVLNILYFLMAYIAISMKVKIYVFFFKEYKLILKENEEKHRRFEIVNNEDNGEKSDIECSPEKSDIEASPENSNIEGDSEEINIEGSPENSDNEGSPENSDIEACPEKLDIEDDLEEINIECSPEKSDIECSPEEINIEASPEEINIEGSPEKSDIECSPEKSDIECSPENSNITNSLKKSDIKCSPEEIYIEGSSEEINIEGSPEKSDKKINSENSSFIKLNIESISITYQLLNTKEEFNKTENNSSIGQGEKNLIKNVNCTYRTPSNIILYEAVETNKNFQIETENITVQEIKTDNEEEPSGIRTNEKNEKLIVNMTNTQNESENNNEENKPKPMFKMPTIKTTGNRPKKRGGKRRRKMAFRMSNGLHRDRQ